MNRFLLHLGKNKRKFVHYKHSDAFSKAKRGTFYQDEPKITNQYREDAYLSEYLSLKIPKEFFQDINDDLDQFGDQVAGNILKLNYECEKNPPYLEQYDAWGKRVDKLVTCEAWKEMKSISAREGLISIAYEKKYAEYSRLYQIAKLYLFAPSSGLYSCPLAMTDGAAKTLQILGVPEFTRNAFERLTSRDPNLIWTSGQWMTERRGGSDVATGTDTIAIEDSHNPILHHLKGYKWFSSAIDADMAITLARIENKDGNVVRGTKGLTMFYVETKNVDGSLNGIEMHKLKNKLGTRQLPTAELLLDGTKAFKLSHEGQGVSKMSSMLNITRIHNSLASVSFMRRMINFARDYATKRTCFGSKLIDQPLHMHTLSNLEVECRGSFLFLMYIASLLGKIECNVSTDEDVHLLRLLTPLLKLYSGKQVTGVCSEALESFGGQGYIEDTGLPGIYRDAQVLPIWEGTTNVLSLDVLRCIEKSKGEVMNAFYSRVRKTCEKVPSSHTIAKQIADRLINKTNDIIRFSSSNPSVMNIGARDFSFSLCRIFVASLMLEKCIETHFKEDDVHTLQKWSSQYLTPLILNYNNGQYTQDSVQMNNQIVLNGHPTWNK